MLKFNVFLSSAMTGELNSERDSVRVLFQTDSTIKEFFSLYVIEEHASPNTIEQAFTSKVSKSDILVILLDKQLREAVKTEFDVADKANLRVFTYIKDRTDSRDEDMSEFISQSAYKYHCGSFRGAVDLCEKIREDIISDLKDIYQQAIETESNADGYQVISSTNERNWSSSRFFDQQTISQVSENDSFKEMSTEQLIILAQTQLNETGNLRNSLLIYEVILHRNPNDWQVWNNRGLILNDMGYYEDALFSYRRSLSLNNKCDVSLYNIGIYYHSRQRYDQALKLFLSALEIMPNKVSALNRVVSIYLNQNDGPKALDYAYKAYEIDQEESTISNLCMALTISNMKEKALQRCEELSEHSIYRKVRAYIFFYSDHYEEALSEIEDFIKSGNRDYDLAIKKVFCLLNTSQTEDAITWLKELETTDYVYATDYNNIGWELYDKKYSVDFAAKLFQKAVDIDSSMLVAWRNLQCALRDLEMYNKGLIASDIAIQFFPDDVGVIMNRSWFLMMNGKLQECVSYISTEFSRLLGNEQSLDEIEEKIKASIAQYGFKDIATLEELIRERLNSSE